jgi:FkbM family methyltransferase
VPGTRQILLAALTRRYPLYSGGIRFANHALVRRLGGTSDELVWARVKGGEVLAGLNDLVGRTAFYTGDLDRKISWVCARIARPGDTVLDIGANIGIVTLWLSKLVGRTGRVYAFEPNPELYEVLEQTIQRNQALNIRAYPIALGAKTEQMKLRIRGGNTGSGSLVMNNDLAGCKVFSVPVRTLDAVVAEERIEAIRLIKIDVEGFEAEVFRGALQVLRRIRPQAVLFEFINKGRGRLSDQAVFQRLQESGYGFFAIPKCRFRMYLERCNPEGVNDPAITDFLAVQRNDCFEEIARAVKARARPRSS